ncbi:MAG TPA: hypothetical protein VKT80_12160 [Chloroflexota bacterium]|nr:hypothetical protein [Chloroflexota bacterium]
MSSIREQIAQAVVDLLSAPGGPGGVSVHRERTRPIESDKMPAILVYFEDDEPTPLAKVRFQAPLTERHLNLVLELRAIPDAVSAPDQAIDPLYLWVIAQLVVNERLGGLAMGITEGPMKWTTKEADRIFAGAALHLIVHYRTSRLDPSSQT